MVSGQEVGTDSNKMLVRELFHDEAASIAVAVAVTVIYYLWHHSRKVANPLL